ncbi:hypothetical protein [Mucilaginibacter sp. KACC 22063]|uniref:hypothetical protein n=1 Tax=Mucilaginibacter sp. KACC 22063 TaxID=3025666 RepID=UPI0023659A10|nr:hypothetical protein [Mucilaginibacter sp. KACC 22063]WDF57172.1 hypothetical protein PQ461_08910 [Mucilaginibacter sp. KACC 22063]
MKRFPTWLFVCLVCLVVGLTGKLLLDKEHDGPYRTTVTVSESDADLTLQAKYPLRNAVNITQKLETWAAQSASRSGDIQDQLQLRFNDGSYCSVHANGRELKISASKRANNAAQLVRLKLDYKAIRDHIVSLAKEKPKK